LNEKKEEKREERREKREERREKREERREKREERREKREERREKREERREKANIVDYTRSAMQRSLSGVGEKLPEKQRQTMSDSAPIFTRIQRYSVNMRICLSCQKLN
jgi:uncharacterized coiled-coil DUF342 family protein